VCDAWARHECAGGAAFETGGRTSAGLLYESPFVAGLFVLRSGLSWCVEVGDICDSLTEGVSLVVHARLRFEACASEIAGLPAGPGAASDGSAAIAVGAVAPRSTCRLMPINMPRSITK
jgi:hypothetical protein